jgi:cbb3-type cytochrome oxidase subunit 3
MDGERTWMGILFIFAAFLSVLYFVYEQERKKLTDERRRERSED